MYCEQGEKLKKLREKTGYSLAKVSKKIDVTSNYLSLIERGQRKPSEVVMYKLAQFYNLNPIEIFSLYGIIPTEQLEKIISSPSLVKILSHISSDDDFTDGEKEELSQAIQEEILKILEKKRRKNV